MTRLCWWLVERISQSLASSEREAVRGDFAESGETAGQALRGVVGLVLRRQLAAWQDWRPWLALIGFVLPIGVLLALGSSWLGRAYDLNLFVIRNYRDLDPVVLAGTGQNLRHAISVLVTCSVLLTCWSWVSGFVLGSLSRRTVQINGALFCLLLLWGASVFRVRVYDDDFSEEWFSLTRLTLLVLIPALLGMRQGLAQVRGRLVELGAWVAAIVTALTVRDEFWWPSTASWTMQLLLLAVYFPVGHLVAAAISTRWYASTRGTEIVGD